MKINECAVVVMSAVVPVGRERGLPGWKRPDQAPQNQKEDAGLVRMRVQCGAAIPSCLSTRDRRTIGTRDCRVNPVGW